MNKLDKKINAAKAALKFIEPGMTVGIGTGSTINLLIEILPEVVVSSPAIILSNVDFPQPDGPTKATNSLSSTSTLTFLITSNPSGI